MLAQVILKKTSEIKINFFVKVMNYNLSILTEVIISVFGETYMQKYQCTKGTAWNKLLGAKGHGKLPVVTQDFQPTVQAAGKGELPWVCKYLA